MTFQSDALGSNSKSKSVGLMTAFKPAVAIAATTGLLSVIQPEVTILVGAAAVTSLSLTFVSLLQSADDWAGSTSKLDGVYAVLVGLMAMASFGIAGGSMLVAAGLLIAMIFAELIASTLIAAGVASLNGMYQAPMCIALNIHSRLFGLLGRAA